MTLIAMLRRSMWLGFLALGVGVFALLAVELAGQLLFRAKEGRWLVAGRAPSIYAHSFRHHPYLAAVPAPDLRVPMWGAELNVTSNGTRWTGAPPDAGDKIRIACLGGSATFGAFVADEATWPAQLQRVLGDDYVVRNYGMLGYTTAEQIIQTALIVPEFDPDIVVFYTGWSDIAQYHQLEASPDYRENGIAQYERLDVGVVSPPTLWEELRSRSGTMRLLQFVHGRITGAGSETQADEFDSYWALSEPDTSIDGLYARNLRSLRDLARTHGTHPVFVPQVVNGAAYEGSRSSRSTSPHIVDEALPSLLDRFGGVMFDVCANDDCSVVDVADSMEWHPRHFVDEGHFSKGGARAFAEVLAQEIRVQARP